jgi:REP element-mobilizing transposase RayT
MTRPLRIDVQGGWYHVSSRGNNRQAIFLDRRDNEHFLELLEEMRERFAMGLHAYALMGNHYHLLITTPEANASRALQWLNVSYSVWWNRRHERGGHVFQGRFKAILVENSAWALPLSQYIHFNPVAVKGLGLSKGEKSAEALGLRGASPEMVKRRLAVLRGYRWSSYRAYAGYERKPEWLDAEPLLRRVKGGAAGYRKAAERRLCGGAKESPWSRLRWGAVLGGEAFAAKVRAGLKVHRESQGRRRLGARLSFQQIVAIIERLKRERWEAFRDRHGDWGRDLALWAARRYTGLTLSELGRQAGGMDYAAVAMATRRVAERALQDRALRQMRQNLVAECAK